MTDTKVQVTMKGNPVTLVGDSPNVGDSAPDATLLANDLSPVALSSFKGKKVVLSVVPSLDTPVCDLQTKRFNEEAAKLGDDVVVLTISVDLPFAQKRWCAASNVESVQTLSDHKDTAFGQAWGLLVQEARLLARAVFIIDADGVVQYKQVVPEITTEPNYEEALGALKNI